MRILAVTALALATAATPAFAQDAKPFDGPRVEVIGGWDHIEVAGEGASGFTYGGGVGYDLQRGRAVFGVEGEVTGTTTKDCEAGVCVKAGRDFYAGVRAGAEVAPNTLLYVKGGYTNARAIVETTGFHDGANLDGFRVGAGLERNFGRFYGKAEYRYSNYESDLERHQIVAGVGLRF